MTDVAALKKYYDQKEIEYGFTSDCKMHLPASELKGLKVLDIGCRRGRGVYKISSMVGNDGLAMGVDWVESYVEEAREDSDRAWRDSGLKHNNMEFRHAYPEDLIAAGIGSGVFDAVYVNNAITLFYDQLDSLREMSRVLKRGGLLILETVFSSEPHDIAFTEEATRINNSIQAGLTMEQNQEMLNDAGFGEIKIVDRYEVSPDRGYKEGETQAAIADDGANYYAVCVNVRKN